MRDIVSGKASVLKSSVMLQSFSGTRAPLESMYQSVSTEEQEQLHRYAVQTKHFLGTNLQATNLQLGFKYLVLFSYSQGITWQFGSVSFTKEKCIVQYL